MKNRYFDSRGVTPLLRSLRQVRGSIVPKASLCALPSALCAVLMVELRNSGQFADFFGEDLLLNNNAAYTGFLTAVSFLLVFRTSQAYGRFWEGMTLGQKMFAEWLDFAQSTIAFTRFSQAGERATAEFHHRLIRLLSLLHAQAAASLRGIDGSSFEILDLESLEKDDLLEIWSAEQPVAMVTQWILELVTEGMHEKVLMAPPPIVSRVFQEFASGVVSFHDAKKLEKIHFPFPYTQLAAVCLVSHCIFAPFILSEWVNWKTTAFILTGLQVMILWALYLVAVEIEAPFRPGNLVAEFGAMELQRELNSALTMIVNKRMRQIPRLVPDADLSTECLVKNMKHYRIDGRLPGLSRAFAKKSTGGKHFPQRFRRLGAKVQYFRRMRTLHSRRSVLAEGRKVQHSSTNESTFSQASDDGVARAEEEYEMQHKIRHGMEHDMADAVPSERTSKMVTDSKDETQRHDKDGHFNIFGGGFTPVMM